MQMMQLGAHKMCSCEVEIIGWAKPHLEPDAASTSLLFSSDQTPSCLLVDCGHGAVSALLQTGKLKNIDAVIITHLHPDHWADLFALRNALLHAGVKKRVALYIGPGNAEVLARICETMSIGRGYFADFFDLHEFNPGCVTPVIGGYDLSFFQTRHSLRTYGVRISHSKGPSIIFTSDTGPYSTLPDDLHHAPLVILECNSAARAPGDPVHLCVDDIIDILARLPLCHAVCITHYELSEREQIRSRLVEAVPLIDVQMAETGLKLSV
jgi:ribonuclease BN (tRNA processing enzyme)